ncbi:MAG: RNA-guided pseudouridylation complex pseudouridine synthase subunit Cbf5 [Promethearchaeota archaeon]
MSRGNTVYKLPADEPEELLVKSQDTSSPEYGCHPEERAVEELLERGVINLDKPSGPTSHEVVSWVKKILNISRAGHGGTLDPRVTGVLPCALGKATRAVSALLTAGKEYVGVIYFHVPQSRKRIEKLFQVFTGKIYQRPPLKSSVSRRLRIREVYYAEVMEVEGNRALFRVGCEAGTYMRKLCHDIGEASCSGAHMLELRRTRVGTFREEENLITLQDLKDAWTIHEEDGDDYYLKRFIMPMEKMVEHIPKIYVRDTAVDALCHGADLAAAGICYIDARIKPNIRVALMTLKKELIGFAIAKQDAFKMLKAKSGIMAKTDRVFMDRNVYPCWSKKG